MFFFHRFIFDYDYGIDVVLCMIYEFFLYTAKQSLIIGYHPLILFYQKNRIEKINVLYDLLIL